MPSITRTEPRFDCRQRAIGKYRIANWGELPLFFDECPPPRVEGLAIAERNPSSRTGPHPACARRPEIDRICQRPFSPVRSPERDEGQVLFETTENPFPHLKSVLDEFLESEPR